MALERRPLDPNVVVEECRRAGLSFWLASEVALALRGRLYEGIPQSELRGLVLKQLEEKDSSAAELFRSFHSIFVRTSRHTLEGFNKAKIVDSLTREAGLPEKTAREIAGEVEAEIKKLDSRFLSGPFIREMVNSKLVEKNFLEEKMRYSRVGLPVFDVQELISGSRNMNPLRVLKSFGERVSVEYTLTRILGEGLSKAHLEGDVFIHGLNFFVFGPASVQNDLRFLLKHGLVFDGTGSSTPVTSPPKKPDAALAQAARLLVSMQTQVSSSQGFDFFNVFLSPYFWGQDERGLKQLAELFVYQTSDLYALSSFPKLSVNLEFCVPGFLESEKTTKKGVYSDYAEEAKAFTFAFLKVLSMGDSRGSFFKWPVPVLKLRENDGEVFECSKSLDECWYVNQDVNDNLLLPVTLFSGDVRDTVGTGVVQEVSVNLARLAIENESEESFFPALSGALGKLNQVMEKKKKIVEKRLTDRLLPLLSRRDGDREYFDAEKARFVARAVGLPEAVKNICGESVSSETGTRFASRVLGYMRRGLDAFGEKNGIRYALGEFCGKNVCSRFFSLDSKRFGKTLPFRRYSGLWEALRRSDRRLSVYGELSKYLDAGFLARVKKPSSKKGFEKLVSRTRERGVRAFCFYPN